MTLQVKLIPVTPFQQNCALIWDSETNDAAVIDPGGDVATIAAAIAQENVRVTDIFLTHGHLDHAGGAQELSEKLGVKITGPGEQDDFLLRGIKVQADSFGLRRITARRMPGSRRVMSSPSAARNSRCCTARAIRRGTWCS